MTLKSIRSRKDGIDGVRWLIKYLIEEDTQERIVAEQNSLELKDTCCIVGNPIKI